MTTAARLQIIMGLAFDITTSEIALVQVCYAGHVQYLDVTAYPLGQSFKDPSKVIRLINETFVYLDNSDTSDRLNSIISQLENLKLELSLKKAS